MTKIPFPTEVDFALTGRCNLRCKHCNTADTWNVSKELSLNEIFDVFDRLKEEKIFSLSIFGGEPFFHPHIIEILEKLNEYPFALTILTNGTLIETAEVAVIKRLRFLKTIQVSLDGSCPFTHDWQRGPGSFKKTVHALELLIKAGVPVAVKAIINTHNYTDIELMVSLAQSLGLRGMSFGDAVECGAAFSHKQDLRLSGTMYRESFMAILRVIKKFPSFSLNGTLVQMIEMLKDFYQHGPHNGERGTFHTCGAANSMLSIRSDGEVVPCSAFWTRTCGNVREKSLRQIWEDSPWLKEIRAIRDEPLTQFPQCRQCDYISYCNGGCRAAAYYACGEDLKGVNPVTCVVFSSWADQRLGKELLTI